MKFHELLPDFYKDNESDWYAFLKEVISPEFDIALEEVEALWSLIDIDTIPEDKLPLLAGNLGFNLIDIFPIPFRKQIANAIDLHRFKGTKYAVQKILELAGTLAEVKEWFEYNGEPYKFKVDLGVQDREITPELRDKLIQLINDYKNERSWLEELILSYLVAGSIKIAAGQSRETEAPADYDGNLEWFAGEQVAISLGQTVETETVVSCQTELEWLASGFAQVATGQTAVAEATAAMEA